MKAFDVTKPFTTRDNRKATFLGRRKHLHYPLVVTVEQNDGYEIVLTYTEDGQISLAKNSDSDLINIPDEIQVDLYFNVYKDKKTGELFTTSPFKSHTAAQLCASPNALAVAVHKQITIEV